MYLKSAIEQADWAKVGTDGAAVGKAFTTPPDARSFA